MFFQPTMSQQQEYKTELTDDDKRWVIDIAKYPGDLAPQNFMLDDCELYLEQMQIISHSDDVNEAISNKVKMNLGE